MTRLFTLTLFLSATLLFMVQPLAGRILLPVLGGSPAAWSMCMLFFQAALLAGYSYAHVLATRVPARAQWLVHGGVLLAASAMLPLPIDVGAPGTSDPRWWALGTLATTTGLPFVALSATAPLLQYWFSKSDDRQAGDPYFLYGASNAGSLLGLLGYLVIEPLATRQTQAVVWAIGFWAVAALVGAVAARGSRTTGPQSSAANRQMNSRAARLETARAARATPGAISTRERLLWIALALVPSALLLGVTQHLATDVVSAPFLWVIPLALYLATFVAAFSRTPSGSAERWGSAAGFAALIVLVFSLGELRYPLVPVALVHLAAFAILAMACHARLAETRPAAAHLTDYFLCVSLGGVLGGVAAALIAPAVFSSILEYPIAIGAAIFLRQQTLRAGRAVRSRSARVAWGAGAVCLLIAGYWCVSALDAAASSQAPAVTAFFGWLPAPVRNAEFAPRIVRASFALLPAALLLTRRTALLFAGAVTGLLVAAAVVRTGGEVLDRERTFFGVHQVSAVQNGDWHVLTHGTTTHGIQAAHGRTHSLPTAYYHPSGPIGDVIFALVGDGRLRDVAVVGLGAGALAAYAGNGMRMDFFEIDEAVIRIAEDPRYFTYLADARTRTGTRVRTVAADGRLALGASPAAAYDLIVVDAFSSDAIPTHLITREAVALYASRLKPRGLIAFHVSSRFFDLPPVLARIAADRQLSAYVRRDEVVPAERAAEAMRPSVWVVLARGDGDVGQLAHAAPRWMPLADSGAPLWTDDYTSLLGVLQ